jgi:hypothetical protein
MGWLEDELGEEDLILAFVYLETMIRKISILITIDRLREIYTYLMEGYKHRSGSGSSVDKGGGR